MHTIFVTIFSLLASIIAYAADTPNKTVSYAAEKVEIAEVTIPEKDHLELRYPSEWGERSFFLNITNEDPITQDSFKDMIDEAHKEGLPFLLNSVTYIDEKTKKEFSHFYSNNSLSQWITSQKKLIAELDESYEGPTDPNTRRIILPHELCFFLVRTRYNTNPPQYKATFLSSGTQKENLITPITDIIKDLSIENIDPVVKRAAFYTGAIHKYSFRNAHLAAKFAKFGLEGMTEPNPLLNKSKAFCLRTLGDYYWNIQKNYNLAIESYSQAFTELSDQESFDRLSALYDKLGDNYILSKIHLFETKAATLPHGSSLIKIHKDLQALYNKIGNNAKATENLNIHNRMINSFKRIFTKSDEITQSFEDIFKRSRDHDSDGNPDGDEGSSKRTRLN